MSGDGDGADELDKYWRWGKVKDRRMGGTGRGLLGKVFNAIGTASSKYCVPPEADFGPRALTQRPSPKIHPDP